MNKIRRKRIGILSASIQDIYSRLQSELDELESLMMEEEDAQESIPESLQIEENEKYATSCQAIEAMEEALDKIDSAIEYLQHAREHLKGI